MNGVHDLGGNDGLGAVVPRRRGRARLERRVGEGRPRDVPARVPGRAVQPRQVPLGMEQMQPAEYLLSPYYEHWVHAAEHHGVRAGAHRPRGAREAQPALSREPGRAPARHAGPGPRGFIEAAIPGGATSRRDTDKLAKFTVGDRVPCRATTAPRATPAGPRYVRGKAGVIELHHGDVVYPDSAGNGRADDPQHVYTIRFAGNELWGPDDGRAEHRGLLRRLGALPRPAGNSQEVPDDQPKNSPSPPPTPPSTQARSPPGSRPSRRS